MEETHEDTLEALQSTPVEKWTESMVSTWLASIGVKEKYLQKLNEQEVDGPVLLQITEDFLRRETEMKSGPALLIIQKRNELVKSRKVHKNTQKTKTAKNNDQRTESIKDLQDREIKDHVTLPPIKRDSTPRPFGKPGTDCTYLKHNVLQPETGASDLISPCHEYKAFNTAATLDWRRLQAKLANEVLRFATGCMNTRSNGTIHFGVMDSKGNSNCVHGEIMGIPIKDKDMYTDALDYIEKCFKCDSELVRQCVQPPEFILVIDPNNKEQHYVVEFDVVPSVTIVRNKVFSVCLPKLNEKTNKVENEKEYRIYRRVGAKTEPVDDMHTFYQAMSSRDTQREEAEKAHHFTGPGLCPDLGAKLIKLVTSKTTQMEEDKWYILVTNKFSKEDLKDFSFLLNMKLFCVFDFDPDSMVSGLCREYIKHHATNHHFMQNYKKPSDMSVKEFENHLHLFDQTSWVFCNGRSDFKGNETPCDDYTWFQTKMTLLKGCVSLICNDILPKGIFRVIFLLMSPVERPLLKTFSEFFTDMGGHTDIVCVSESEVNFQKWHTSALEFCPPETIDESSVVGMKMSHVNATLQQVQKTTSHVTKLLPVYVSANCSLHTRAEEGMYSLEILSINQCDEKRSESIDSNTHEIEKDFYHGGKVTWMNFWLAENGHVGEVIQRDAYHDVTKHLEESVKWSLDQMPINCINICHHPGSGGSTVARQILWNHRKKLRCAVVKPSYPVSTVSDHAVKLREYDEKDFQKCLPVLLLLEDCDKEYIELLKYELKTAVSTKKIERGTPCFVLLCCRRSNNPEKIPSGSDKSVTVTHKLSKKEKRHFARKRQKLEEQFEAESILTFVLMSEEFEPLYVKDFVQHLLEDIDRESIVTQLILYVALLNTYVENSFISQSHCEAFLRLQFSFCGERFREHHFQSFLTDEAKLIFIHLRDERTHIKYIRIIHQKVAEEILHQLLGEKQQSDLATDLLRNDLLFEHRFGEEEYRKFLRELFMRRHRISKGDTSDSLFAPLIEHVRQSETPQNAIELLKEAYNRFSKDAYFAQQLARLCYWHESFEDAEHWANTATTQLPKNSYILDTKGQVYRRWFTQKCKSMESRCKTAETMVDAIETALNAIECFQKCQKAATEETESMNNSGFFGAVEVGCSLLELLSSLDMFSSKCDGRSELLKYLLTEYIPKEVEKPWEHFHNKLKNLQQTMHQALEWISEELSYFQTNSEEEEISMRCELTINRPKRWLVAKSRIYGRFFGEGSQMTTLPSNQDKMSSFSKRMKAYQLGGGNLTAIFDILNPNGKDQKTKDQKAKDQKAKDLKDKVSILEEIISLYSEGAKIYQADLVNYIASHFALSALSNQSPSLITFNDLQSLSQAFLKDMPRCSSDALFLSILLSWPEEFWNDNEKEDKYKTILTAVKYLQKLYSTKMKGILPRRRRIYTHFYLGNGVGYQKFVHKSKIKTLSSVSAVRLKWVEGEIFKTPEIARQLKCVTGWTEDGTVYLEGPKTENFQIHALNQDSVPAGNENVTFYLGFTLRGPVACDITVPE